MEPRAGECDAEPVGKGMYPELCGDCRRALAVEILEGLDTWMRHRTERGAERKHFRELATVFELGNPDNTVTARLSPHVREYVETFLWKPRSPLDGKHAGVDGDVTSGYRVDGDGSTTLFRWQVGDLPEIAEQHGAAMASRGGSSAGGNTTAKERRRKRREKDAPLLDAVHRLEQADPPRSKREIIDALLPRYGGTINNGDDYYRARDRLRKRIKRARDDAAEESPDE